MIGIHLRRLSTSTSNIASSTKSRLESLRSTAGKLDLKHFIYRSIALKLYRDILRVTKGMPPHERSSLVEFTRSQFEISRNLRDQHDIKRLLADGKNQLERLRNTMWMAK